MIRVLREDAGVDAVILHINLVPLADRNDVLASMHAVFGRLRTAVARGGPPVLLALRVSADPGLGAVRQELASAARSVLGFAVFHELDDAIRCLAIGATYSRGQHQRAVPVVTRAIGRADAKRGRRIARKQSRRPGGGAGRPGQGRRRAG